MAKQQNNNRKNRTAQTGRTGRKKSVSGRTDERTGRRHNAAKRKKGKRKSRWYGPIVIDRRHLALFGGLVLVLLFAVCMLFRSCMGPVTSPYSYVDSAYDDGRPPIDVELLTPNEYSRPCMPTDTITGIVIHYVGNPGTTAMENRNYFEGLKDSGETYASSNFIIGLDGEIIQCVPTSEIAYCSNERNIDTVSIEVCHPDDTGEFTGETYNSLVCLTGWLCTYLDVSPKDVIRHYDVTGKICPKYFVDNEDAWKTFKKDVSTWVKANKTE